MVKELIINSKDFQVLT